MVYYPKEAPKKFYWRKESLIALAFTCTLFA